MSKQSGNISVRAALLLAAAIYYFSIAGTILQADQPEPAANPKIYNINYTDKGFSPKKLKIKSGDSIRWTNKTEMELQLAEGSHPKHTDCKYCPHGNKKGSYILIDTGESYTFKFIGAGATSFHDHLRPGMKMKVIVSE